MPVHWAAARSRHTPTRRISIALMLRKRWASMVSRPAACREFTLRCGLSPGFTTRQRTVRFPRSPQRRIAFRLHWKLERSLDPRHNPPMVKLSRRNGVLHHKIGGFSNNTLVADPRTPLVGGRAPVLLPDISATFSTGSSERTVRLLQLAIRSRNIRNSWSQTVSIAFFTKASTTRARVPRSVRPDEASLTTSSL